MHESASGEHRNTSEDIGYTPQRAMARAKQLREKESAAQITTIAMRYERSRLPREGGRRREIRLSADGSKANSGSDLACEGGWRGGAMGRGTAECDNSMISQERMGARQVAGKRQGTRGR